MSYSGAILRLFILSGAAGLIYEVVWARQLVLVFGNTTQAISAILTGYFGGMAIGSVIGGRVADRVRSPLRLYGVIELLLVVVVLLTPVTFRLLHEVYRGAYGALQDAPTMLALLRFSLSLLALGPATVLLGATLPVLSRQLARGHLDLSPQFGRLYAANTLGAILGTELAGFVLIELVGLTGTLVVGALCSGTAGAIALALSSRGGQTQDRSWAPPVREPRTIAGGAIGEYSAAGDRAIRLRQNDSARPWTGFALTVAFVSGLTSLGYQVLWTRLLASGSGNTTYVFTTILTFFLAGIVLGAHLFAVRLVRVRSPLAVLAVAQLLVTGLALAGLLVLGDTIVELPFGVKAILVVLPTTFVMGVTFPLASRLLRTADDRVGTSAGLLLGANTLGAIVGSFVVPFVLIPLIGSPRAVAALALVNAGLAFVLVMSAAGVTPVGRRALASGAAGLLALALLGLFVPMGLIADPGQTWLSRNGALFASAEDEIASVQAGSLHDSKSIWVAGTSMTALTVSTKTLALLPLMLRPDAESMLLIAFGMGSTHREGLLAGLQVESVELVPSVPRMFGYYFPDAVEVLANPRGRVVIADGRNHVELTDRRYDLIVVDPPPPVESAGTSVLFSREFYAASAARLAPGGLVTQWVPAYISVDEFRDHVRTFSDVFPDVVLAFDPAGDIGIYMFGAFTPIEFEPTAIRGVLIRPGVLDDLRQSADSPATTLDEWEELVPSLVWLSGPEVRAFAGAGPLITDDRPLNEYFLFRRQFARQSPPASRATLEGMTGR